MHKKKLGSNFDDLDLNEDDDIVSPKSNLIDNRENQLNKVVKQEMSMNTVYQVDPGICRMWDGHNRRYDLLSSDRCSDLIEGFIAQGKQEFPAIVRPVEGEGDIQYEVICGARRHWTVSWLRKNNYPNFKFLVEPRELTDEEAFRLADIENRDREDISDYERSVDYKRALEQYYNSQKEMAKRLEMSESNLTHYIQMANLPIEVIEAYPDVTEIRVSHSRKLSPHLKKSNLQKKIISCAKKIKTQRCNGDADIVNMDASYVTNALVASFKRRKPKSETLLFKNEKGEVMIVGKKARNAIDLKISLGSGASKKELIDAFKQILDKNLQL